MKTSLFLFTIFLFFIEQLQASPSSFNLSGKIVQPNGFPLESSNVQFTIGIYSPGTEKCLLYEETHTINMSSSKGVFSLPLGEGSRPVGTNFEYTSALDVAFNNFITFSPVSCDIGTSYSPSATQARNIKISFDDGAGPQTLTYTNVTRSTPYALFADKVGGKSSSELIQVKTSAGYQLSQSNIESIFTSSNFTELTNLLAGTSTQYLSSSASGPASFNNQRITNLATPTSSTDATNKNYVDTNLGGNAIGTGALLVGDSGKVLTWNGTQWVASTAAGDSTKLPLAGGTMSGALNMGSQNISNVNDLAVGNNVTVSGGIGVTNGINSSGDVAVLNQKDLRFGDSGSHYVAIQAPATVGSNITWTLPATNGTGSQVLSNDGAGVLSWIDMAIGDITGVTAGTGLTGGGSNGAVTINADIGTAAGQIVINSAIPNCTSGQKLQMSAGPIFTMSCVNDDAVYILGKALPAAPTVGQDGQFLKWDNGSNAFVWAADNNSGGTITALTGDVTASGSGSVAATIAAGAVDSGKIADGTIANADISATAAIADTKLATISTAGKVSNTATTATSANTASAIVARDASGNFSAGSATLSNLNLNGALNLNPIGTNPGETGQLVLYELAANGTNTFTIKAPDALTADRAFILPESAGSLGHVLTTDGAGNLSWALPGSATSVSASDGSAATPAMAFASDTNTGLYLANPDTIGFAAGGVARMTMSSTELSSATANGPSITLNGTSAASPSYSFVGDTDTGWYHPTANTLAASTDGLERVRLNASGNLGIGTNGPISKLDIYPGLASTVAIADKNISLGVRVLATSGRSGFTVLPTNSFLTNDDNAAFGFVHPYDATNALGSYKVFRISTGTESGAADTAATTIQDRFYVRKDGGAYYAGNVGIGTTTTNTMLDVRGAISAGTQGAATGQGGEVRFYEIGAPGINYVGFRAPDNITADKIWTLPASDGSANQVLTTNGSGTLSWAIPQAASSVSASSGTVATPSISFSGDTDTGFYSPGANQIGITVGGTQIWSLDSVGLYSPTTGGAAINTASGTQAAPTFSFSGDSDTGWFRPAANTMAASTGGTERVRIDSSGNVGIGTNNPSDKLHVNGKLTVGITTNGNYSGIHVAQTNYSAAYPFNINAEDTAAPAQDVGGGIGFRGITNTGDSNYLAGIHGGKENATLGNMDGYLAFYTRGGTFEKMRISSTGNVGIGTTNPGAPLEVNGIVTSKSTGAAYFLADSAAGQNRGFLTRTAGNNRWNLLTDTTSETGSNVGSDFQIARYDDAGAFVNSPFFIKRSSGNVGIGTTNPSSKLDVAGTIRAGAVSSTNGTTLLVDAYTSGNITTFGTEYSNGGPVIGFAVTPSTSSTDAFVSATPVATTRSAANFGPDIRFFTGGVQTVATGSAVTISEKMRIQNNGNVGIGTTNPGNKLSVSGNLDANNYYIGGQGVGDAGTAGFGNSNGPGIQFWGTSAGGAGSMVFTTGGSTKMTLLNSGNVGIGTTNPSDKLDVNGGINVTGGWNSNTTNGLHLMFGSNTGYIWSLQNGTAWRNLDIQGLTVTVTNNSDVRLKSEIKNVSQTFGLDSILKLRPVTYRWIDSELNSQNGQQIGFIAQEVEPVFPHLVKTSKSDAKVTDDNGSTTDVSNVKSLNYNGLVVPIVQSIKDLYQRWFADSQELHRELASVKSESLAKDQIIKRLEQENAKKTKELQDINTRLDKIEKAINLK